MYFNMEFDDSILARLSWLKLKIENAWVRIDRYRKEDEVGNQLLIAYEINNILRIQAVHDHFIYN